MILKENKRAKRVNANTVIDYPKQQETCSFVYFNHPLNVEELKGNIVTNKKVHGKMER